MCHYEPMRILLASCFMLEVARASIWSLKRINAGISSLSDSPAFVKVSPRCERSNSRTPRLFSSVLICLITAEGVMKFAAAAFEKLPHFATCKKDRDADRTTCNIPLDECVTSYKRHIASRIVIIIAIIISSHESSQSNLFTIAIKQVMNGIVWKRCNTLVSPH